ncbi:hypothetical protein [Sphingomonas sp.]|uniref:hypothetical protein n=1 Tax=Sphingomonas sp. TaxID=28214 RepID=UPI003BA95E4C
MDNVFSDVKPWPEAEPAPVAGVGDNSGEVPMEVKVVDAFVEGLSADGLLKRIKDLTDAGNGVTGCSNRDAVGRIADFVMMAGAATKAVEEHREKHNRPLLTSQRALKGKADTILSGLSDAVANARKHMDAFLAEEARRQREEEARIAREAREAEEAAARERARLQAEEDARAAAEGRAAETVEVEPEPVFAAPKLERGPVARGDYGSSVSLTETWDVEVLNVRQVPDAYLKHPSVIEALEKVIRSQVRGKNGIRELKGCRIFSRTGSAVR